MDLDVFQEKKVMEVIYTRESGGYLVAVTAVPSPHCGGIAIFYRDVDHFTLEALHLHSTNVISFHMVSGGQPCHVVGCYITPYNALTIESVIVAISQIPRMVELLVASKFNADRV